METRTYRLTLIGCAACWFLIGLHAPALHQMTHHGRALPLSVLAAMIALSAAALAGLWVLLRLRPAGRSGTVVAAAPPR